MLRLLFCPQGDEQRLYELIVRHFLACCSQDAQGQETTVEIDIAQERFVAQGLMILARNYLDVYPYDRWSDKVTLRVGGPSCSLPPAPGPGWADCCVSASVDPPRLRARYLLSAQHCGDGGRGDQSPAAAH